METAPTAQQIYHYCLSLLARREHSQAELKQKLMRRYGLSMKDLFQAVLERLVDENCQSDLRFAESFIRSRLQRGFGPNRIKQELQQKGLHRDLISCALAAPHISAQEQAQIERVWRKKFNCQATTVKERLQQRYYLLNKGFQQELVEQFFNQQS
jgi:regulatory protein